MKYEGKLYAKLNGRYIELTQTVEDLENEIAELKSKADIKSCMYCEKKIPYSEGLFICFDCQQ